MLINDSFIKMVPVDGQLIEAIGYVEASRHLYIKFRGTGAECYHGVPRFRYQGLLAAPLPDKYFKNYIKGTFLAKDAELPKQV